MADRRFIGRLGGITQIVFALLIGSISIFSTEPDFIPRGVVVVVAFALPGVVGLIGTFRRRPALMVAAGVASAFGSFTAFSGVTLIFLVPALLMLVGSVEVGRGGGTASLRATLLAIATVASIVPLLVGAGAAGLLVTDAACWETRPGPMGPQTEVRPYTTGEILVAGDAVSGGCTNGLISARGVALMVVLGGGALGLATLTSRRRADDLPARADRTART